MADTRDEIGKALEGALAPDQLKMLLDDVLEIRKKVWGDFECKHCGQRQRQLTEIPDAKAVTDALAKLLDQSWGRPKEQSTERSLVVNREVILVRDDDDPIDVQGEPRAADSVLS